MSKNSFFSRLKSAVASVAAVAMAVGMSVAPVQAATTVTNNTDHEYKAYQVFKGTQSSTAGDTSLGDIEWGNDIDSAKFLGALQADSRFASSSENTDNAFKDATDAKDVADVLVTLAGSTNGTLSAADHTNTKVFAFAELAAKNIGDSKTGTKIKAGTNNEGQITPNKETSLDTGYYVIVDTSTPGTDDAYQPALLQITNQSDGISINKKYAVPTLDKDIEEADATATNVFTDKDDATDRSIGDTVYYQTKGTLPTNYGDYTSYKYVFHDKLSAGQALQNDIKVWVKNGTGDAVQVATSEYTVGTEADGTALTLPSAGSKELAFKVSFDDLKKDGGIKDTNSTAITIDKDSIIVLSYSTKLTTDATIGATGNPNEAWLEYSNKPGYDGTGTTTHDKVIVFTYELDTTKIDGTKVSDNTTLVAIANALPEKTTASVSETEYTKGTNGWTVQDSTDVITDEDTLASIASNASDVTTATVSGNSYTKLDDGWYLKLTGAQFILKATGGTNQDKYAKINSDGKVTEWGTLATDQVTSAKSDPANFASDNDTKDYVISSTDSAYTIKGLDAGSYQLIEIKAPSSYNLPSDPFAFKISANTGSEESKPNGGELTELKITVGTTDTNGDNTKGIVTMNVKNTKGSSLPSTGGAGRFIYVGFGAAGLALVVALLAVKRRRRA